ncbi:MAG: dephospho-CoA kinase [Desulfovibrionales bacterium]
MIFIVRRSVPTQETGFQIIVPEEHAGMRLDMFWAQELVTGAVSRARIQGWIRQGRAAVEGVVCTKPGQRVDAGQKVTLVPDFESAGPSAHQGALRALYTDTDLVVVDKPAGLVVHPAPGLDEHTLVNRLLYHFPQVAQQTGPRPGIVHRLDKDTSGLMVVALKEEVRQRLSRDFAARNVDKEYLAIVHGTPVKDTGEIDLPIGRDPRHKTRMAVVHKGGRSARSRYRVLAGFQTGEWSLLKVQIFTGRTHQIRVHLSALGHPIVGDTLYGGRIRAQAHPRTRGLSRLASRQMLHAFRLKFFHPGDGRSMDMSAPPPRDFRRFLFVLDQRCQKVGITGLPGSGKSTLLAMFRNHGLPVWSADETVHRLYHPGKDGWVLLRQRFGDRFVPEEGSAVDKKALAQAMLREPGLVREVEHLIHPLVRHALERFFQEHALDRVCVAEVPLLLETGWSGPELFDLKVGVFMSEGVRRERLQRKGWSSELIGLAESRQWGQAEKMRACDLIVDNSGDLQELATKATALGRILKRIRRHKAGKRRAALKHLWEHSSLELTRG